MIYIDSSGCESDEWDMGPLIVSTKDNNPETEIVYEKSECDQLVESIERSDLLGVQNILENSEDVTIDTIIGTKGTALMYACATSQSHIVEYLINKGSNVNRNHLRQTPLLYASSSCTGQKIATVECVKLLLSHNARVNVSDFNGLTPLMHAIINGHDDVALMLLPNSNINMEDCKGWKAAFYAVHRNNPMILRKLILNGASLNDMDANEVTLKAMAQQSHSEDIKNIIDEFASNFNDDEHDEYQVFLTQKYNWLNEYPDISDDPTDPEYSYDVFQMLYGMNCEGLILNFDDANLSLQEFLSLDKEDLINIGVNYPYQRHKVLQGINRFFRRQWNAKSVCGLQKQHKESFDIIQCLTNLSFHRKQMVVIICNLIYFNKKVKEIQMDDDYNGCMLTLNKNIRKLRNAVQNLKSKLKSNDEITDRLPPDYISSKEKYRENYFKSKFISFSLKLLQYL